MIGLVHAWRLRVEPTLRKKSGAQLCMSRSDSLPKGLPMRILLQPTNQSEAVTLEALYDRAIRDAVELFIVTAYLTDWQPKRKITRKCRELSFIVGTDFGLTRKNACRSVLDWLPEEHKNDFLAADCLGGFHPKLLLWKNDAGQFHLLLGSSNLTQAAFFTNYEVNVYLKVSKRHYEMLKAWVNKIRVECSPIS